MQPTSIRIYNMYQPKDQPPWSSPPRQLRHFVRPPRPPLERPPPRIPHPRLQPKRPRPKMRNAQPLRRRRHHHLPTRPTQNLRENRLGHGLDPQNRHHEPILLRVPRRHLRLHPIGHHAHGPHFRRVVARLQLGGQALVEGERAGFAAGVVGHVGEGGVGGEGGDGHDHAVVGGDHGGEEGADEAEVGEEVDGEGFGDGFFGAGEDGAAGGDAGVVDEDGGGAEGGADGGRGLLHGFGGGDVAVVEVHVGCCWVGGVSWDETVGWGIGWLVYYLRMSRVGCPAPPS